MVNIWLTMNADLSTLEVLFADAGDMGFIKTLPECPKLQIIGIFVSTDVAVFPALELPAFLLLGMVAVERWTWMFFATSKLDKRDLDAKLPQFKIFCGELASMFYSFTSLTKPELTHKQWDKHKIELVPKDLTNLRRSEILESPSLYWWASFFDLWGWYVILILQLIFVVFPEISLTLVLLPKLWSGIHRPSALYEHKD
jgi:hypothetical protein